MEQGGTFMPTLLWLESGSCSGESMTILGSEGAGRGGDNLLEFLEKNDVELLWHPSISRESPRTLLALFDRISSGTQELTLLCIEGSIIHGPGGTGRFDTFDGRPKKEIIRSLCAAAHFVFAMGTCASFGGIPAAPPNISEAGGLQFELGRPGGLLPAEWRSRGGLPVLNLAGCPVDAATMIRTMTWVLQEMPLELDRYNRPFSVRPCLSDATSGKCGTSERVGYACYGCIAARFPLSRPLFDHVARRTRERGFDPASPRTFTEYGKAKNDACPPFNIPG